MCGQIRNNVPTHDIIEQIIKGEDERRTNSHNITKAYYAKNNMYLKYILFFAFFGQKVAKMLDHMNLFLLRPCVDRKLSNLPLIHFQLYNCVIMHLTSWYSF